MVTIEKKLEIIKSCGNVYADVGFPNPEIVLAKAELATIISEEIKRQKADLPEISAIVRGQLSSVTFDQLFRFLNRLGIDVFIKTKPCESKNYSSSS